MKMDDSASLLERIHRALREGVTLYEETQRLLRESAEARRYSRQVIDWSRSGTIGGWQFRGAFPIRNFPPDDASAS